MKTIKQICKETKDFYFSDLKDINEFEKMVYEHAFNTAIEFANKWIDIEDEFPPINELVIAKYRNYEDEKILLLNYQGDEAELGYVCEWKPIEFK